MQEEVYHRSYVGYMIRNDPRVERPGVLMSSYDLFKVFDWSFVTESGAQPPFSRDLNGVTQWETRVRMGTRSRLGRYEGDEERTTARG